MRVMSAFDKLILLAKGLHALPFIIYLKDELIDNHKHDDRLHIYC